MTKARIGQEDWPEQQSKASDAEKSCVSLASSGLVIRQRSDGVRQSRIRVSDPQEHAGLLLFIMGHYGVPVDPIPEALIVDLKRTDPLGSVLLFLNLQSLYLLRDSCSTCPTTHLVLGQIGALLAGLSSSLDREPFFRVLRNLFFKKAFQG